MYIEVSDEIQKMLSFNYDEKELEFEELKIENNCMVVWRVEKLQLKKVPEQLYGLFFSGDSFLILKVDEEGNKNIHIWIGKESSKDEIQFVNYKALQLDNKFGNDSCITYENQGRESSLFKTYFSFFFINKGGIDASLEKPSNTSSFKARLFHIHIYNGKTTLKQVPINKKSLDSTDAFLFDLGARVFVWRGTGANGFEKFHVASLSEKIKSIRNGKVEIVSIDENGESVQDKKNLQEFEDLLKRFEEENIEEKEGNNEEVYTKKMMKLSDESGKLMLTEVNYDKNSLITDDLFIIDRGDSIIVWVGKKTSKNEKRFAKFYVNRFEEKYKRPLILPIIMIYEGKLQEELDKCFTG